MAEEKGISDAEHSDVEANAERKRHNHRERKSRIAAQGARSEGDVLQNYFNPTPSPIISCGFSYEAEVSEFHASRVTRDTRRITAIRAFANGFVEMAL